MIENRPFATRARTLDHLGREQIADVPTAVSELWKNSYDAYATNVQMTLFQQAPLMVALHDNGQGMTKTDILEKWLVIGTDSKVASREENSKPIFGLQYRPKQGQKGIGRLSSAHIGPLLLMISKSHDSSEFVAVLIDWRVFQNPYLILSDITTPVLTAPSLDSVFDQLPKLTEALAMNVAPKDQEDDDASETAKNARIREAWKLFDSLSLEGDGQEIGKGESLDKPSEVILHAIDRSNFNRDQLGSWEVANKTSDHGTALLISETNEALDALLSDSSDEDRQRFVRTLVGFVDPFDPSGREQEDSQELVEGEGDHSGELIFNYSVDVVKGKVVENIISSKSEFSLALTDTFEHIIEGRVDADGYFRGVVKSFGSWVNEGKEITIEPPNDLKMPDGKATWLGAFDLYIATIEQLERNTTHTEEEFRYIDSGNFDVYYGLRVYRNGLRVMPYGRPDTDFFEIEKRRSMRAGTEFWNERRMFGRLAISQEANPNLRDKAGREGFIVNTASRTFKRLVVNILMISARRYFGSRSEIRQSELPEIQKRNSEKKAREHAKKVATKNRRQFRKNLKSKNAELPAKISEMRSRTEDFIARKSIDVGEGQELLEEVQQTLSSARVPGKPRDLKSLEEEYAEYRRHLLILQELAANFSEEIDKIISEVNPPEPWEIAEKQLQRQHGLLQSRISKWTKSIRELQSGEEKRIGEVVGERSKLMYREGSILVEQLREGRLSLSDTTRALSVLWQNLDAENEDIFENYIFALESLTESIDLQTVALVGEEENAELRSEVDRLNSLAQLGIAVEILGHELKAFDNMIGRGLDALPANLRRDDQAGRLIEMGYHGLTQQLQFLAPLQLSGERIQRRVTGAEIHEYLVKFFGTLLQRQGINLRASEKFKVFSTYGQPARLFPVFINLVNNSQYWVSQSNRDEKEVLLDVSDGCVFVSDNGPGVSDEDVRHLFTLFFTRRSSGGRGIGLYLCRANLAAGLHEISYITDEKKKILPGANFAIRFKKADFPEIH